MRRNGSIGLSVALLTLVAGLGVAGSLIYLLIARPITASAGVEVSEPTAEGCPVGERAPVCYLFEVTNTGDESGSFSCETQPPADSLAVFQNDESRTVVVLGPGQRQSLLVKVTPLETDTVGTPSVSCDAPG